MVERVEKTIGRFDLEQKRSGPGQWIQIGQQNLAVALPLEGQVDGNGGGSAGLGSRQRLASSRYDVGEERYEDR